MKHSTYTDPITYWEEGSDGVESQHESMARICSFGDGDELVTKGVRVGQLIATAPQLLDACQEVLRLLDARTGLNVNGISVDTHNIREAKSVLKAAIGEAKS